MNNMDNNTENNAENKKLESIRKTLFVTAIAGILIISAIYGVYSFLESKHSSPAAQSNITKDKDKCRYVGKSVLALTQEKGAEIFAQDSTNITKDLATVFKHAETTSNMIREKGKFTAFVIKDGVCSIEEKNCSINVGLSSAASECVFYLDEKTGIQPSMDTAEFIKEETPQE